MDATVIQQHFTTEAMPHFTTIRKKAFSLANNKNDAEDLVQETFMQAWKSFGKYEFGTNCRAWLFKILLNKYNHFRRGKYVYKKYFKDVDEYVFFNARDAVPVSEHLTDKEMIRALNRIPELYRIAIVLVDIYEFSYKETAAALGIPMGTVMSRLNRGRKGLRKIFEAGETE